jgi:hypothetical protein
MLLLPEDKEWIENGSKREVYLYRLAVKNHCLDLRKLQRWIGSSTSNLKGVSFPLKSYSPGGTETLKVVTVDGCNNANAQ